MTTYNFYDTSSLLLKSHSLFNNDENIVISSITLEELDKLKSKNPKARQIIHLLDKNQGKYEIIFFESYMLDLVRERYQYNIETNDMRILATAIHYDTYIHPDETVFYTNDRLLALIANLFFGEDSIKLVITKTDDYKGYISIELNEEEHALVYEEPTVNRLRLLVNQYGIITHNGEIVDKVRWDGNSYQGLRCDNFKSTYLGNIKPYKDDIYQQFAFDSLLNNKITMLKGKPGSGKSLISLGYLFYLLEKHSIDKIIIFCNTVATKNSFFFQAEDGIRDMKLLDSQIGNFLSSKLGDMMVIEQLINEGKLLLLPLSDLRGYDTSGMRAGIYITEAQNMDISLMKLALQRVGEDNIVIIDGDCDAQVDDTAFEGDNNGMKRLSKVFRGFDLYGEVELQQVHRSRIAQRAEKM